MKNIIAIKKTSDFGWDSFDIIVNSSDVKKVVKMNKSSVKEFLENYEGIFDFEYEEPEFVDIVKSKDSVYTFEGNKSYDYHIVDEKGLKELKRVSAVIFLNFNIDMLSTWDSPMTGNNEVDYNEKIVIYKSSL